MNILTQPEFDALIEHLTSVPCNEWMVLDEDEPDLASLRSAYAAALARIAEQADKIITLEAQLDALREQVDRLLTEAAHA